MSDYIDRQEAIDAVLLGITYAKAINKSTGEVTELSQESNKELTKAADRIKELPSVQPESSEYEELDFVKEHERIPVTLTVQPQQVTGKLNDCISRKAAVDALMELVEARHKWKSDARGEINGLNAAYCAIEDLPSVQPQKTGKWVPKENRPKQEVFICSECGGWAYSPWIGSRKTPKPNKCKYSYCPHCGADMRG